MSQPKSGGTESNRPNWYHTKNVILLRKGARKLRKFVKSVVGRKEKEYYKPLSGLTEGNIAVFTQVKNEKVFLPIWINHYSQYFNTEDLYVLDHQSKDGSADNLSVNRIITKNPYTEDNKWRVGVVEAF